MSNYPRDEFDRVLENSARHGVHRSSLETTKRSLVPIMVFGAAALCIGLLAFLIVPNLGTNKTDTTPIAAVQTTASASPTTSSAPTTTAAPTPVQTPSATPTAVPTPDSVVNKTTPLSIYNATGVSGLAAKYSATVTADGWTVAQAANWAGAVQGTSSIIYNGVAQKANAEALSKLLGIATLIDSAEMGQPLVVILGPGAK